jgi:MFS family permease
MNHDQPRPTRPRPRSGRGRPWPDHLSRPRPPVDLAPLRVYPQFRLLWSSRTVTLLGTGVSQVALLVQVKQLTGSAVLTGLLGATEIVPLVAFGLYGGVLADRVDRRLLAVWAEIGLAVTAALLTANALAPRPLLWPLYASAAVEAALAALQRPALNAAVPRLLRAEHLAAGSALLSVGTNAAAIAGPAIGGLLASSPGPAAAYGLHAASFCVSVVLLLRLRPLPRPAAGKSSAADGEATLGEVGIRAGLRYARRRQDLLGSYFADMAAMLLAYPASLFPFLAAGLHASWATGLMFS